MAVLKTNEDYQKLLNTLALLEAQKIQAIKDLERLEQLQLDVERRPYEVYKAIARDQTTGNILPCEQTVVTIPNIDWTKYDLLGSSSAASNYNTRKKNHTSNTIEGDIIPLAELNKTKKKMGSFGQPWTEEEQRRLEDLLKIYPSEEVEAKRWQKIANALGNRTTKQVCCRVQKYFIKLAKAGLPVPGRMPNLATYSKKCNRVRRSSTRQPSLFFNSLKPKVYMTSDTVQDSSEDTTSSSSEEEQSYDGITSESPTLSESRKHVSTDILKCIGCDNDLRSIHWQCTNCNNTILLCLNCVKSNWSNDTHLPSHDMTECLPKQPALPPNLPTLTKQCIDTDYTVFKQSSSLANYNYLDPNFCPAL